MDLDKGISHLPASFRDPSGFIFTYEGEIYRQVNNVYAQEYEHLMKSGLYDHLVKENLLIPHQEVPLQVTNNDEGFKTLKPQAIPFISYPYEWCFSQLKDAALTTLKIQKIALHYNMSLKDASAFNIQFYKGNPILIDTLSFEFYREDKPWIAYYQFCKHFLSPLALMSFVDFRMGRFLGSNLDGIPLDLTSKLLPLRTYFNFGVLLHIKFHSKFQSHIKKHQITSRTLSKLSFNKNSLLKLIDNLESTIYNLKISKGDSVWSDYYNATKYSPHSFLQKKETVERYIELTRANSALDIGANIGLFSKLVSAKNIFTVSIDSDHLSVEKNYLNTKISKDENLLPLWIDITNPSPSFGWAGKERASFLERGSFDLCLVLALLHHLIISNNLNLDQIAKFLYEHCKWLIIEFVPKSDPNAQLLSVSRRNIYHDYDQYLFERTFERFFQIVARECIKDSERILYLLKRK